MKVGEIYWRFQEFVNAKLSSSYLSTREFCNKIPVVYLFFRLHDDEFPFVGHLPLESTERLLLSVPQEKAKSKQQKMTHFLCTWIYL